jgi:hypothetical protein
MPSILDFLQSGVTETARGVTAFDEGKRERGQADEARMLARLARDRQTELDGLQRQNILSMIAERERAPTETFGQPFAAVAPGGKVPQLYRGGNRGTVEAIDLAPVPSVPKPPTPGTDRTTAATRNALAQGMSQLDNIRQARDWVRRRPESFGLRRGAALLPGMGQIGDVINQHTDPDGNEARQFVANVASLEIKDRSGAAVTVSEFPRLAAFVPQVHDTPEKIESNLNALERELLIVLRALQNGVSLQDVMSGNFDPGGDLDLGTTPSTPAPVGSPRRANAPRPTMPPNRPAQPTPNAPAQPDWNALMREYEASRSRP